MTSQKLRDVMTRDPFTLNESDTLGDAARAMRERGIGAVVVLDGNQGLCGIVTDRDIVVRGIARGADSSTPLSNLCSAEVTRLSPDDSVQEAVKLMAKKAIRRIPILEDGKLTGIVSIGDLAQANDERSALAGISAAAPNT